MLDEVIFPLVPKVSEALWGRRVCLETPFLLSHSATTMRSRYAVREQERAHFVASTIVDWLPVFPSVACREILAGLTLKE